MWTEKNVRFYKSAIEVSTLPFSKQKSDNKLDNKITRNRQN